MIEILASIAIIGVTLGIIRMVRYYVLDAIRKTDENKTVQYWANGMRNCKYFDEDHCALRGCFHRNGCQMLDKQ